MSTTERDLGGNGEGDPTELAPFDPFMELGVSGLKIYGGILQEEFLRDLQGEKGTRVYREMQENDPVIGAMLFAIDMLVRQVEFRVEPADPDTTGEWATFVESCLHDMSSSWPDVLTAILSFLPYGWAYHEIVYKRRMGYQEGDELPSSEYDDGLVGWRKLSLRAQETRFRWILDDNGGVRGMVQVAPPNFQPTAIPIEKALLFRTTTARSSPEGRAMLRNAYQPWWFKRRIQEIEAIGIERDLAGLPVMSVPVKLFDPQASVSDKVVKASLERILRNIRRDEQEGVLMPQAYDSNGHEMYKLELLTTGGRRQFDTDSTIARYDQRMAMTLLEDFIMLGHEKVGTFQLATSKVELFATAISAWLDSICGVFNSHAIPRLMKLNGKDLTLAPKLTHADVERADLKELGVYVLQMAQAGMPLFPDAALEEMLREIAGLPQATAAESVEGGG